MGYTRCQRHRVRGPFVNIDDTCRRFDHNTESGLARAGAYRTTYVRRTICLCVYKVVNIIKTGYIYSDSITEYGSPPHYVRPSNKQIK